MTTDIIHDCEYGHTHDDVFAALLCGMGNGDQRPADRNQARVEIAEDISAQIGRIKSAMASLDGDSWAPGHAQVGRQNATDLIAEAAANIPPLAAELADVWHK